MKEINTHISKLSSFLENFDKAWDSTDLPKSVRNSLVPRIQKIRSELNNAEILKELTNINHIGVIHTSDLLTYLFVSRLCIDLGAIIENHSKVKEFIKTWFSMINYLLITNIFEPNKNLDEVDMGTEKYKDTQVVLRKVIVKEILSSSFLNHLDDDEFKDLLNKFPYRTHLNLFKTNLGITTTTKNQVINEIITNNNGREEFARHINNIQLSDTIWESLSNKFMPEKTPRFLLKNVGLASELFTLIYLMRSEKIGSIIPLLLHQRLYSGILSQKHIDIFPPDFLVINKGRALGVELGRGKYGILASFPATSGVATVEINPFFKLVRNSFGFKCNLCSLCYTICDAYIDRFSQGKNFESINEEDIRCEKICGKEKPLTCPDATVCFTPPPRTREVKDYEIHQSINGQYPIVHYQCLKKHHPSIANQVTCKKLIPLFPYLESLNKLEAMF